MYIKINKLDLNVNNAKTRQGVTRAFYCLMMAFYRRVETCNFINFHLKFVVNDNMVLPKYRLLTMYLLQGCIREYSDECIKLGTQ